MGKEDRPSRLQRQSARLILATRPAANPQLRSVPKTRLVVRYKAGTNGAADAAAAAAAAAAAVGASDAGNAPATATALAAAAAAALHSQLSRGSSSFTRARPLRVPRTFVLEAASEAGAAELLAQVHASGVVEFAEIDQPVYPLVLPSECGTSSSSRCGSSMAEYAPWKAIRADMAWAKLAHFGGVAVQGAVLDTGIDYKFSPELYGQIDRSKSTSCMDPDSRACNGTGLNAGDHGTACAGIIAARHNSGANTPLGVMSSASLVSCQMMNATGGYASDAADCIYDMIDKGAAAVLSNSWGDNETTAYLEEAVAYACQNDVLFVAAAGNEKVDVASGAAYPAGYVGRPGMECVLSVAATDAFNNLAYYTNWGAQVQIAAPGNSIFTTIPGGRFMRLSGTSMAAPFVSGAALALRNLYPQLTALQIKEVLITSATIQPGPLMTVPGSYIAGGLLDVQAALAAAADLAASIVPSPSTSPTLSPDPSLSPTPTSSPSPAPSPKPSTRPRPSPRSPEPSPSHTPSPPPEPSPSPVPPLPPFSSLSCRTASSCTAHLAAYKQIDPMCAVTECRARKCVLTFYSDSKRCVLGSGSSSTRANSSTSPSAGYCDKASGQCLQCVSDTHCKGSSPYCAAGACVDCRKHGDCRNRKHQPYCLPGVQQCVSARRWAGRARAARNAAP